jgi:AraC-like DNA-binding protein
MEYGEYAVPEILRRHLQCVWRLRDAHPGGAIQTIYPDGRCELIVHLGSPPRCWDPRLGWHEQTANLFAGQRLTAVRLAATQALDCVGVRLKPAAAALMTPSSLDALRDRIVDLAPLDTGFCAALRAAVHAFTAGTDAGLWRLLTTRCASYPIDARIEAAVERLEASAGQARIAEVARGAAVSIRAFQMRFRAQVGLTPKEFARLVRLQATLRALDGSDAGISELAAAGGFADQAHATRELQRVTGLTPARLRAELRRDRDGDTAIRMAAAFVRGGVKKS